MAWVIQMNEVRSGQVVSQHRILTIDRADRIGDVGDIGLRLSESKEMLRSLQEIIVTRQFELDNVERRPCVCCGRKRTLKDYNQRKFDTIFGTVTGRRGRFKCKNCMNTTASDQLCGRSTLEYDSLRARLAAHLPYRVASQLLQELMPASGGSGHTSFRNHTLALGAVIEKTLKDQKPRQVIVPAKSLTVGLDTGYIRAKPGAVSRHMPILVGEVLNGMNTHRYFSDVQRDPSRLKSIVGAQLAEAGYSNKHTKLTVLTDGDESLRNIICRTTGQPITPVLDWFHIAMRLQHLRQTAKCLSTRIPSHIKATREIQLELQRLRWRLWNGKKRAVDDCFEHLMTTINTFHRLPAKRREREKMRSLGAGLCELKRYVRGQANTIVNYRLRQTSGMRISTSRVESAVNHLVNRRMNKSQQMQWSTVGASRLLQVRTAVINGDFERLTKRSLPSQNLLGNELANAA